MSFYGSVYYQLIDAFHKAAIKNTGKNKNEFLTNIEDESINLANGRKGEITFDTGNKWIQLSSNEEENSNAYYNIWHAAPDEGASKSFQGIAKVEEDVNLENFTRLGAGEYFSTDKVIYDDAGHISKIETNYFQLPDPDYEVSSLEGRVQENENNIKEIQNRDDAQDEEILSLRKGLNEVSPEKIIELENFKNSTSETLVQIEDNINALSEEDEKIKTYIGSDTYFNNLEDGLKVWNLSQALGSVSKLQNQFDDTNRNISIIDALQVLKDLLGQTDSNVGNISTLIYLLTNSTPGGGRVEKLEAKVIELENRIKELEDAQGQT